MADPRVHTVPVARAEYGYRSTKAVRVWKTQRLEKTGDALLLPQPGFFGCPQPVFGTCITQVVTAFQLAATRGRWSLTGIAAEAGGHLHARLKRGFCKTIGVGMWHPRTRSDTTLPFPPARLWPAPHCLSTNSSVLPHSGSKLQQGGPVGGRGLASGGGTAAVERSRGHWTPTSLGASGFCSSRLSAAAHSFF